jgi:hypothetical protein
MVNEYNTLNKTASVSNLGYVALAALLGKMSKDYIKSEGINSKVRNLQEQFRDSDSQKMNRINNRVNSSLQNMLGSALMSKFFKKDDYSNSDSYY